MAPLGKGGICLFVSLLFYAALKNIFQLYDGVQHYGRRKSDRPIGREILTPIAKHQHMAREENSIGLIATALVKAHDTLRRASTLSTPAADALW